MTPYTLRNAVLYVCPKHPEHRMFLCEPVDKLVTCGTGYCDAVMTPIPLQVDGRDLGEFLYRFALQAVEDEKERIIADIGSKR